MRAPRFYSRTSPELMARPPKFLKLLSPPMRWLPDLVAYFPALPGQRQYWYASGKVGFLSDLISNRLFHSCRTFPKSQEFSSAENSATLRLTSPSKSL